MLDMGFIHDVKKVLARLPAKRQNLLFSATFSKDITDRRQAPAQPGAHRSHPAEHHWSVSSNACIACRPATSVLLAHLITLGAWEQVLVFTRPSTVPTAWPSTWKSTA